MWNVEYISSITILFYVNYMNIILCVYLAVWKDMMTYLSSLVK